ncbi:sulfatase [Rubritalea spongiae]|uniref:Sulfatase n=1 Tax=Rubritalea spongiae TaxID=430797 RepID=A0ABW5E6M6_9BACT
MRSKTLNLLGFCLFGAATLHAAPDKPNIVVIMADDMGYGDSETYGNDLIKTPNMNRLAKEGVKFTAFYSPAGVCSPSRSAILTGRTPYRNGVWRHLSGNHEAHLRASEITYPKLLKGVGYDTCHVGKWHLLSKKQFNNPEYPQPGEHGYNYWMYTQNNAIESHKNPNNFFRNGEEVGNTEGYSAQLVAGEAVHWLKDVRDKEKPFVLSVWFHEPHSPIATDPRFQDLYEGHENSKYMGNITQMDNGIGMVLDALDKEGVSDNTLVIFTSDNGPVPAYGGSSGGLRGNKRSGYEGGIRVPGLVRWPAKIKPGTVSDVPVIATDIFTTALELADVPVPTDRTIDGASLLPAFEGKPVERKTPLFWRTHVSSPKDRVAMRVGDWKIVGDETLTKFQLFNIKEDRNEENDLAKKMPEKTDELKAQIIALWKDIEKEGPNEWWEAERQKPSKGGKLSY